MNFVLRSFTTEINYSTQIFRKSAPIRKRSVFALDLDKWLFPLLDTHHWLLQTNAHTAPRREENQYYVRYP